MKLSRLLAAASTLLMSTVAFAAPDFSRCTEIQNQLDELATVSDLNNFLTAEAVSQELLDDVFFCNDRQQYLPTQYIESAGPDYIRGIGLGVAFVKEDNPLFNLMQTLFGRQVWGGKIMQPNEQGGVDVLNIIHPQKDMLFASKAVIGTSILDGKSAFLLDYRGDQTVPFLSRNVIRRVRDELREVYYRGEPSMVYIGRANMFKRKLRHLNSDAWDNPEAYTFAANFVLDFNPANQSDIPDWQKAPFEK